MFIGYFLTGYLLASLKIEKMTDILRMRRFQTLMTSVRVEIRQNLWQVRFVLLRMLWSANLKARGFLLCFEIQTKYSLLEVQFSEKNLFGTQNLSSNCFFNLDLTVYRHLLVLHSSFSNLFHKRGPRKEILKSDDLLILFGKYTF